MKKNVAKILTLLLVLSMVLCVFAGCSEVTSNSELAESAQQSSEEVSSEEESSEEVSSEEDVSSEEAQVPQGNQNPLTGTFDLDEGAIGKRPVAIMINNIKVALPQSGIADADLIYEMPVEGGITRMMAVYADYTKVPTTGSIRSARHNYLELALPLDAIYVHFGGSNIAKAKIQEYGIKDDIDGLYSMTGFMQDKSVAAAKGKEHSYYTTGALLQKAVDSKGIRSDSKLNQTAFKFADEYTAPEDAQDCSEIKVKYSGYVTAKFTYNAEKDSYSKQQFGQAHIDANTGETVSVHNVFVLYTNIYTMDKQGHQQIDLNSGSGYYCTGGKYQKITWSKGGINAPFVFKDAAGNELTVSAGNSWVCIVPNDMKASTVATP